MKNFTLTFFISLTLSLGYAQNNFTRVQSSCNATEIIISKYQADADYQALEKIYAQNISYKDSIAIPKEHSDTILNALIAIYNAVNLPERDTVVDIFDIHTDRSYSLKDINIIAHPDLDWMQKLEDEVIPTGNSFLDSLLSLYQLSVQDFRILTAAIASVSLKTNHNLNLNPLADLFETMPGVVFSAREGYSSIGLPVPDIEANISPDYVELIYVQPLQQIQWKIRYWKFRVYYDCTVEFIESYGDIITSITDNISEYSVKLYPNPFTNQITADFSGNDKATLTLYDQLSRQMLHQSIHESATIDTEHLPKGLYLYEVRQDHRMIGAGKLIKQ